MIRSYQAKGSSQQFFIFSEEGGVGGEGRWSWFRRAHFGKSVLPTGASQEMFHLQLLELQR